MATKLMVARQFKLDGTFKDFHRFFYEPGEFARLRAETKVARCEHCDTVVAGRRLVEIHTFDPWSPLDQTEGDSISYYCQACDDQGYSQSGSTFWCEGCSREIWDSHGHRLNYKTDPEYPENGTIICVGCFQRFMLEHGHTDKQINSGSIACDFYSYSDLESNGWEEGETFDGDACERDGGKEWREYCLTKKAEGYLVLTDQGRTSIIGGPDTITVWLKRTED